MKLAVMQPYFFPYIGYFQMVGNCNLFVSYDSVNYIQRGWINRNRILISKEPKYITVPVSKAKLETPISEIKISDFNKWKKIFLKTIELSYKKAPYFDTCFDLLTTIISNKEFVYISDLAFESIRGVSEFLELDTKFISSSKLNINGNINKEERLENFIYHFNADNIILPPGSVDIYKNWKPKKCIVKTMQQPEIIYNQFQYKFIKNLSIIDVLMYNSKEEIIRMVKLIKYL